MHMKKMILLLAIAGMTTATCLAQDKSQGKIDYEVTMNLHASLKPDQLQYKDMIPEKVTNKEVLYFNGGKTRLSLKDPDDITSEEGATVKVVSNPGQTAIYTDAASGGSWSLMEEDGQKALVAAEKTAVADRKPGTGTKEILGFTCHELTMKSKDKEQMTLWVTDALPFSAGPMGISAGKGLVLGVDSKKINIIATAINYAPVSVSEVSIPEGVPVKEAKK
jgi:GLPGLI family protein